ncbi:Alpha/Beta hydrolase protein [Cyathus striatus]|nr:Alpha/Beta hydrolase protein [Cyathus striatus]
MYELKETRSLMHGVAAIWAALSIVTLHASSAFTTSNVVDLGYAKYRGFINNSNTNFLGVRFAASPTGTFRFRAPQPPETTLGVQQADKLCTGVNPVNPFKSGYSISEDCLFLNIYIPSALDTTRSRPVLVWIHGDLIIVTIQYRVGAFGFLAGEEVKKNGDLNAGLHSKFGGDPTRVTIWGISAGAGSVLQHIVANGGHTSPPLFRGVITSSTFVPSQYAYNDPIPEVRVFVVPEKHRLACLRSVDAYILEDANVNICRSAFYGTFAFVPVVDGDSLLSVTNTFEGALYVNASTAPTIKTAEYILQLFPMLGHAQISAVAAAYADQGAPIDQVIGVMGESIFICPTYYLLHALGGFAIPPGGHGDDEYYYFTSMNANGVPRFDNAAFDTAFPWSFVDFAMTLNPNVKHNTSDIKPLWNTFNTGITEMLFNKTDSNLPDIHTLSTSPELLKRCAFWESVGALTGQ